ncbi:hypothetical protein SALWKB12_2158 [Snodgrassella communis]|uniref:Uncharacterized protein n=1 Tax=Snodgrassella communis TaxID=2946699 RepID=A0A836MPZ8_9NEIS|nr:hypothetical protein SALWKB12_2158 [Snodgrassella communis]KDN14310.1 hypothetical protein SALWKB29_1612 [Snodgrassella communis]
MTGYLVSGCVSYSTYWLIGKYLCIWQKRDVWHLYSNGCFL